MKTDFHSNRVLQNNKLFLVLLLGCLFILNSSGILAQPTANFSTDVTSGCIGLTVQFSDATTGIVGIPSYNWNFGSGASPATATTPGPHTVTYTNAGTVTVSLTVTDENGSSEEIKVNLITIIPRLPVSVTVSASANPVCEGSTVTFTALPVNGGSGPSYQWYVNSVPVGTNANIYSYVPVNGDVVRVMLTSSEFCTLSNPVTSDLLIMSVNALPSVSLITGNPAVCVGSTTELSDATVGGVWSSGTPGVAIVSTGGIVTGVTAGTSLITYTVSSGGCINTATQLVTVYTFPTISDVNSGSRCGPGVVLLGATVSEGTINWYSTEIGGESLGSGTSFTTPVISVTTTYYVDATNNGCTIAVRTPVIATVMQVPSAAGPITGAATFTPGTAGVPYSIASIPGATGYIWGYSGTGVTINGSGTTVTLDFAANATSGSLSVYGTNTCGQGIAATLTISPSNKTLTLTSVLLEGLYNGSGTMRQAQNATGAQWPAGVADHITVELHNGSNYATIVWSQADVSLSTAGTAIITVPAVYNGSYYITVKHRNSIETTTSSPVSFAGTIISRLFGSAPGIYGANLRASGDGYFLMFGGDVNQDGYVDSGDYPDVVNDNFKYMSGYLPTDINGDGIIDSGDYPIMVNNNLHYIGTIHP